MRNHRRPRLGAQRKTAPSRVRSAGRLVGSALPVPRYDQMKSELAQWEDRRYGSDRANETPFPPHWVLIFEQERFLDPDGSERSKTMLVRNPEGAWMLVYGLKPYVTKVVMAVHVRFEDLYTEVAQRLDGTHPNPDLHTNMFWIPASEMLHAFIAENYNRQDEVEAAEQMVLALGGTPARLPAVLLSETADMM
jgi:hypothetical protein